MIQKRYQSLLFCCLFTGGFLLFPGSLSYAAPKTLVLSIGGDPKTFNLLVSQDSTSSEISRFLFDGLTDLDPATGEIKGLLAERWEVFDQGLRWVFHLRPGVHWSDGQPFTAQDVVFTFETMFNPAFVIPARDIFTLNGKRVEVKRLDDLTVEFLLPEPFAPFLLALGQPILPSHRLDAAVKKGSLAKTWGIDEKPENITGTGPFRIKKYSPGERIELEKNPFYWKTGADGSRLPRIERITLLIIQSPEGRLLKFMEGSLDVYPLSGRDYPVLKPLAGKRNFSIYQSGLGLGSNFLVFNQGSKDAVKKEWFRSQTFREAAASALDRQSMVEIVLNHLGGLQCSAVSPSIPFFYHETPCREFDPEKSRQLLEKEGFKDTDGDGILEDKDGHPLEFVLMTNAENPERVELSQMIREDLSRTGMKVHLLVAEFNSLVSKLVGSGEWDAVLLGLTGAPDPHFGANVWKTRGSLHFWEPKDAALVSPGQLRVDAIFETASGLLNRVDRKRLYDEWQEITARELPLIYTVLPETMVAVRNRFSNFKPTVLGGVFSNLEEIDVAS